MSSGRRCRLGKGKTEKARDDAGMGGRRRLNNKVMKTALGSAAPAR